MRLFPRHGLPGDVRDQLALQPGERVLASARTPSGSYAVATDRALHHERGGQYVRLAWEDVAYASWDRDASTLSVVESSQERHLLALEEPERLPETVRERVMASIVVTQHVPLAGRRGVRIAGRRRPGGRELHWTLTFDPGLNPDDPGVRAAAEQALTALRAQTGV
jgi:hypothetical protein